MNSTIEKVDLSKLNTPEKARHALEQAGRTQLEQVIMQAQIYCHMVNSGWDVSFLTRTKQRILARISSGDTMPEIYIAMEPRLAAKVSMLPRPLQAKMLDDIPVEVVNEKGDIREVKPSVLSNLHLRQVFDGPRIRPIGEQREWLETELKLRRAEPVSDGIQIVNQGKRKGATIGKIFVPLKELARIVASLSE